MLKEFRIRSLVLLILLVAQFVLGMILNLFVKIPNSHPGNTNGNYFVRSLHSYGWAITIGGGVTLFLHVLVATGLVIGAIVLLVRAIQGRNKLWIWISTIALLGMLMAFSNGLSFLDYNHAVSSLLMALGFILAAMAYVWGVAQPFATKSKS